MLKPKSPQESFYGSYLYDRIVPVDHLLRKINQVVDFSFAGQILQDRYHPDIVKLHRMLVNKTFQGAMST